MAEGQMKHCIMCCEQIPGDAKKCSHCNEWQARWPRLAASPFGRMSMILVVGLLLVSAFYIYQMFWNPWADNKDFERVRKDLKIANIQLLYSMLEQRGPVISTIGTVKNDGDIAWDELTYQVQYYNSSNQLVDTTEDWQYRSILAPHSENTFKVKEYAVRPKEDYATAKVIITSGKKLE